MESFIDRLVVQLLLDIDECAELVDDCVDICQNTNGSYYICDCRNGYSLNNDKYTYNDKSTLMSNSCNCMGTCTLYAQK